MIKRATGLSNRTNVVQLLTEYNFFFGLASSLFSFDLCVTQAKVLFNLHVLLYFEIFLFPEIMCAAQCRRCLLLPKHSFAPCIEYAFDEGKGTDDLKQRDIFSIAFLELGVGPISMDVAFSFLLYFRL